MTNLQLWCCQIKQSRCHAEVAGYIELRSRQPAPWRCLLFIVFFFQTRMDPNCPEMHSAWAGCVARLTFIPQYYLTNAGLWLSLFVTYPKYREDVEWFSSFFSIWTVNKTYSSPVVSVLSDWKGWSKPVYVSGRVYTGKSLTWSYPGCKKHCAFQLDMQAQWICMLIKHHLQLFISIHIDKYSELNIS